ncbi:uncharacterized protein LOC129231010 [Uloborus diversus]|uniref:uncharacterized protein LOC129231010 n=1 Tax=Uloborus diversus TaxID=327109 RepID=UPI002408FF9B|nr:uncharacterized protein LOC129231010 [Uloborus diversus]
MSQQTEVVGPGRGVPDDHQYAAESAFYPSRTIVVQNFLPEAETHVRSLVAMFGVIEVCEIIRDDSPSWVAVVQYRSKVSAADALLAMPYFKVRGSHLVVHLLWNGPYEQIDAYTQSVRHSFTECNEKRVVCIGLLPRNISAEVIGNRCQTFGTVHSVKIQPQNQGAFAYVVFLSPFAAAIATFCLRNSTTSSAALMLGYSEDGNPVLLGPVRVRPLDQYPAPLSSFDLRCICARFFDYACLRGLFVDLKRKAPIHHYVRPGMATFCVRIPTAQVKGVSLFIEILLFEDESFQNVEEVAQKHYNCFTHKTLFSVKFIFRFSADFGLHKPVLSHNDGAQSSSQSIQWNSFFVLDLQVCRPWLHLEPKLTPIIQGMNHIYSEVNPHVFEEEHSTTWFGDPVRYGATMISACSASSKTAALDVVNHQNKIKFIVMENIPIIRLVGSRDGLNGYKIPIHVYSGRQKDAKIL